MKKPFCGLESDPEFSATSTEFLYFSSQQTIIIVLPNSAQILNMFIPLRFHLQSIATEKWSKVIVV